MPFTRQGGKRPPNAGRHAGTPNKATRDLKDFLRDLVKKPDGVGERAAYPSRRCCPSPSSRSSRIRRSRSHLASQPSRLIASKFLPRNNTAHELGAERTRRNPTTGG